MIKESNEAPHIYDVIIIGAGCSGLKAGETLSTNGIKNILVLEAQDRIGGRINTIWLNDGKQKGLEMGATWLHGILNNPLKKLIADNPTIFQHYKTRLIDLDNCTSYFIDLNGKKYNENLCKQIELTYYEWFDQSLEFWNNKDKNKDLKDKSLEEYFDERFKEYIENDTNEEIILIKRALYKSFCSFCCKYIGCNKVSECSLNELGSYRVFGPDEEFPGSYSSLIQYLANRLPENSIRLNHPVSKISIENDSKDNFNLKIECKNDSVFFAKHLIVTCSLNYLKENYKTLFNNREILFNEAKVEALNGLNMGVGDTCYLIYENDLAFIPSAIDAIKPMIYKTDDDDMPNNNKWQLDLCLIIKAYDNVLRIFSHGENAIYLESASDDEIALKVTELLKAIFRNEADIPLPKQIIRSKWYSNPYIRGCYSYIPVNSSNDCFKKLAEPIYFHDSPKILLAGEGTSDNFYSTVHGAYTTGENQANCLIKHLKKTT